MEKANNTRSRLVLSKQFGASGEKIIFHFGAINIAKALLCFGLQFSGVFASMSPFGTAFYASIFTQENWIINFCMALLGIIMSGRETFWNYAIVLTALTAVFAMSERLGKNLYIKAAISAAVFALFGAVRYISSDFSGYDIMALILEATLLGGGVIVFTYGFGVFARLKKRTFISEKESICAYALLAIAILSLQKLPRIAGLSISTITSILIIYIMSLSAARSGALTLSVLLGVIGSMEPHSQSTIMGTYAFGALLASAFKRYGKTGVVLGFVIANTVSSLFLSDAREIVVGIYDSFAAALIFIFVPNKAGDFFAMISEKNQSHIVKNPNSPRHGASKRIESIASSVGELGKIYEKAAGERNIGKSYIKMMACSVSDKVCMGCHNKDKCFEEKNGAAYAAINEIANTDRQRVSASMLPQKLRSVCHRCDSFAEVAANSIQIMKTEKQWLGKINESRRLIADQLNGLSDAIKKESKRIDTRRDTELEERLWTEFDIKSIQPIEIYADKKENGDFDIEISFRADSIDKLTKKNAKECIEKATSCSVEFAGMKRDAGEVTLAFCPHVGYSASFGYATRAKSGEQVCGDSFNVIYTDRNKMAMALSDGMGSGKTAQEESKTTITLLEKFLAAGFDCDMAVKLINSSLLLKGEKDTFATIDICDINLNDSTLTFTKLGAASAYIASGGKTLQIKGKSLPAGILKEAQAEKHMLPIDSDSIVVLMSDGVADIALKENKNEDWIEKELANIKSANPQIIAGKLIDSAIRLSNGSVHDDMTVLVACISKSQTKV